MPTDKIRVSPSPGWRLRVVTYEFFVQISGDSRVRPVAQNGEDLRSIMIEALARGSWGLFVKAAPSPQLGSC